MWTRCPRAEKYCLVINLLCPSVSVSGCEVGRREAGIVSEEPGAGGEGEAQICIL